MPLDPVGAVVDRCRKAFWAPHFDSFAQVHSPEAQIVAPGGAVLRGRSGAQKLLRLLTRRFPEMRTAVQNQRVVGSTVLLEGKFTYAAEPIHPVFESDDQEMQIALERMEARFHALEAEATYDESGRPTRHYAQLLKVAGTAIRSHWLWIDEMYAGSSQPWEIDDPQPSVVRLANSALISGHVLDVGCGTGSNALFLAELGHVVVGIDQATLALHKARLKAEERGLRPAFIVGDVKNLPLRREFFDTVIDSGLLHTLFNPSGIKEFVTDIHGALKPGGRYHVICLSERASCHGARRLSQDDILNIFAEGWAVESIEDAHFELRPTAGSSRRTGAAWLASMRRV